MCSAEVTTNTTPAALKPNELLRVLGEVEREGAEALLNGASRFYDFAKRIFDIVAGAVLLVLTMPIMTLTALAIKMTSRGPIFFRQQRTGLNGRTFTMYKFRSMCSGAEDARPILEKLNENDGPAFKIKHDPRVTRIGRFLRRSSLDELPQLINVLSGQMSLVGPRPLPVTEAKNVRGAGRMRTTVKPGLTCLWQISGRNELTFQQWMHLDLYYIRHRSLLLDLAIIIQTIPAVLSAHGAY
ncbi:MAG: sugar transferase [Planctomycetota bacterium]|nr:sugar transferase [Planctomycetota bacterium]